MTKIFLSYDGSDRDRAGAVRGALRARGYEVDWEQEPPAGMEWETWMRGRLAQCKCVVVLRSAASHHSNRMSHVSAAAKEHGKLIVARLEPRHSWQAQAGASADALDLANWHGNPDHPGWQELCRRIESKLKASLWVRRLLHDAELERAGWRARYETSAARCRSLNDELAKERSEKGAVQDKAAGLQAQIDADARARFDLEARIVELEQRLADADGRHAETRRLLTEAQSALDKAQDEPARLRSELAAMQGVHGELRSCVSRHESVIAARDSHIMDLDANVVQRDAEIAALKAAAAARDTGIAGLNARICDLNADMAGRDADIDALRGSIADQDGHIAGLEAGVAQRDASIASLLTSIAEHRARMAHLEASIAQRDTHIADLKSSIVEQDTRIATLRADITERDTHVASLMASLKAAEQRPWRSFAAGRPLPAVLSRLRLPVLALAWTALTFHRGWPS